MPHFGGLGKNVGRMGVVGGASYNPLVALGSDLLAWWDADSKYWGANGAIDAASVGSWKDIIAAYDAAQGNSSAKPVFSTTAFNGAPGVTFDGVDDNLSLAV